MNASTDTDPTPDPAPPGDSRDMPADAGPASTAGDARDRRDAPANDADERDATLTDPRPVEIGGQKGPEPTRYGDWEKKGRCTDF